MPKEQLKIGDLVEFLPKPYMNYRRVNHVSENGKQLSLDFGNGELTGPFPAKNYRKVVEALDA